MLAPMRSRSSAGAAAGLVLMLAAGCTNNPYREGETAASTYFGAFSTPPGKLDPTSAYYAHEGRLIDQIYEPPFTYHYLKRPYTVIPQTAESVPVPVYYDADGRLIEDADPPAAAVARAEYTIRLRRGILYQDHPCFARRPDGTPAYAGVTDAEIRAYAYPADFPLQGTRELTALDYALQVRRLADPRLGSPVFSTLAAYVDGLAELQQTISDRLAAERARRRAAAGAAYNQEQDEQERPLRIDYLSLPLPGIETPDPWTLRVILKRKYPQIVYWMCMHFFAPVPPEALDFYEQPALARRHFTLNSCPVGTGPYFMRHYRPNERIVLEANPNYHEDRYPAEGAPGDREAGLLADAGRLLPMIRRQDLRMEKESLSAWNKFLQGYYDASAIASEVFDQAIQFVSGEEPSLSPAMRKRHIRLATDTDTMFWYTGFNMLDDVVGGYTPQRAALRQAISIALDYNEFLDIFANGRGIQAQSPLPPGIFGYRGGPEGVNPFTDRWDAARGRHVRRPIEDARRLLAEAGYPDGIGPDGLPLTLHYDHSAQGESFFRSYFEWMRKRLDLIGVRIVDRGTDLSRYRQKTDQGNWQLCSAGWLADYPDPENFLFLFYGPNGKVANGGPNAVNYSNPAYDRLFEQLESMRHSPARQNLIDRAVRTLQEDAPAVWQYHPVSFSLHHAWLRNFKPHQMSYNTMKYKGLDAERRVRDQHQWNRPVWWPAALLGVLAAGAAVPAAIRVHRREHSGREAPPC